jgi:hypothetical protein
MNRILFSIALIAFAVAVQAGDTKSCSQTKDQAKSSCGSEKVKTSDQAKGGCCSAAKESCCKESAKQVSLPSPKASDNKL